VTKLLPFSVRVLITGATGLLGRSLLSAAPKHADTVAISRHASSALSGQPTTALNLDVRNMSALSATLATVRPHVIIHAAAEGNVDAVQGNAKDFEDLNVSVTAFLAQWCRDHSRYLAYVSSNAVFGGRVRPYADDDPPSPINDYGRLKATAETAVSSCLPSGLIFRRILMYGWPGPGARTNPAAHWVSELRAGQPIRIVRDVVTQPLASSDAAKAIWRAVEARSSGSINASGGVSLSLHEFALLTADTFDLDKSLITGIESSELTGIAPRPRCTIFDNKRLNDELRFHPLTPSQGLREMYQTETSATQGS